MWDVDFTGIGAEDVTMLANSALVAADEGKVVKISADKEAGLCDAEDVFYGELHKLDLGGSVVAVTRKGFVEVSYTGTITPGHIELVADGSGGVKAPDTAGTGKYFHVVSVDSDAGTLMLDLG